MRRILLNLVCLFACFGSGAIFGKHQKDPEKESLSGIPNLDYFIADQSFSEIKNGKAVLAGLAARFREEFQVQRCMQFEATTSTIASCTARLGNFPYPDRMVQELESEISEFSGTDEELALTGDLLRVLRADGLYDRWLRSYLTALYAHPTNWFVAAYAHDAMAIGRRVGRQTEVVDALRLVDSIPLDFASKSQVQNLLLEFQAIAKIDYNEQALGYQARSP